MSVSSTISAAKDAADSARRIGESVIEAAGRWNDPRQKQIRRVRRARRRRSWFGGATGASALSTAGLAVASAPEWTMIATGGGAALLAVPTVFAITRYKQLNSEPLPARKPGKSMLPARHSSAFTSMNRLAGAQRSLYELTGVLLRSESIASEDILETTEVAYAAAAALTDMSTDIVAMERAAESNIRAGAHLTNSISGAAAELEAGVDQYEELVEAAARLTSPTGMPSSAVAARREELSSATDRLQGWAFALDELAEIRRRHP
ncbi:hypothetical protein BJD99_16250 [Rhodococcus sp. 1163]|uniref:phage shock envelope stress response protein PspM n=1 Tax=Rhodococcus sp. 1163 TaxID=1905289 RepID=UPI000A03BF23|nr:hypothetical protein [Rhodococcus sp. 1163]ORI12072.1 hypothetical protein BJD99_16250 [Rhodococcus sp. 1163]